MKNNVLKLIISTIILAISAWAFYILQNPTKNINIDFVIDKKCGEYTQGEINFNNSIVKVLISDSDCKKSLGLSGVKGLKNNEGMIFEFDKVGKYGFWMKDMLFPIDILWIDTDLKVINIENSLATSTYPKSYGDEYFSKYVIELPAGYSIKNNIKVGDKIIFHTK